MQVVECNYNLEKAIFILANIDKSQVKLRKSIVEAHNIGSTATLSKSSVELAPLSLSGGRTRPRGRSTPANPRLLPAGREK
jgi:hypothetical protein